MAAIRHAAVEMRLDPRDRGLIAMPLFHVGAKLYQSARNLCGGSAYMADRFDPGQVLDLIGRERITVCPLVPTMLERVFNHPGAAQADHSSLRLFLYTGAAMPGTVIRKAIGIVGPRLTKSSIGSATPDMVDRIIGRGSYARG